MRLPLRRRLVVTATGPYLLPDISEFQWFADLPGIKRQNGGAVIIRMHNGWRNDYVGVAHRAAARKAGFSFIGLYQYVVWSKDVVRQAQEFCALVGRLAPGEFAYMDLEESGAADDDQHPRAMAWMAEVQRNLAVTPNRVWLYSYPDFVYHHNLASIFSSAVHTAIAGYGTEPSLGHTLWQSTDGVTGPYITAWAGCGECDTNVYWGSLAHLASLLGGQPVPPPQPPPPPPPAPPGKDILDMSTYVRLSRKTALPLAPDQWVALRFDEQLEPPDPHHARGDWRQIVGTPSGAAPTAWHVMGDAVVTLTVPVVKLELQAVAATSKGVRQLAPAVAYSGIEPVLEHQLAIHGHLQPGENLFVLARSSEETGITADFSGFASQL